MGKPSRLLSKVTRVALAPERRGPAHHIRVGLRETVTAALGLLVLVGVLLSANLIAHHDSKAEIVKTFRAKGKTSAAFVATFVEQQAAHEKAMAQRFLAGRTIDQGRFEVLADAFSATGLLLDSSGRVIADSPRDPRLIGQALSLRYPRLAASERGSVATTNVVPSAVEHDPVVGIAVPIDTAKGRRVFSADYAVRSTELGAFVAHATALHPHAVYLVDADDELLASSPAVSTSSLRRADPDLFDALRGASTGTFSNDGMPSTFTSSTVPGTTWRLIISVPDSKLYASISGFPQVLSWIVLMLSALLGSLLVFLLGRSFVTRARLATEAAITQTMADGVMLVSSATGQIVFTNLSLDAMLGYGEGELVGQPVASVNAHGETGHQVMRSRLAGGDWHGEIEMRRKGGRSLWCAVNIQSLEHPEHGHVWVAVVSDITARKDAERSAEIALGQAIEASQAKSRFVANMSHEIRTPLNGVVGMTNLLRDSALDPVQREYADALSASSEALMSVINDVLDFSKLESGQFELDRQDFELRALIEDVCLMFAEPARAKGLEIIHWVDVEVPDVVNGDRARVRQILLNLLSNAVKFTAEGEIVLKVSRERQDHLRFEVRDTGIGIDEDQADELFDAFAQADASTTRQFGGTGLGLAISRELVIRMAGQIQAYAADPGSVFCFTAELPEGSAKSTTTKQSYDLAGVKALIADDNQTNLDVLGLYLASWGLTPHSVSSANEAITELERAAEQGEPFELAVLDFNMPDLNGAQLISEINARPPLHGLHIVVLSSSPLRREMFEGQRIPPHLTKPARQSDLYDAIVSAMSGESPSRHVEHTFESDVPGDRLPVLVAEDNEINRAVAKAMLAKLGHTVHIAHNGREAVEMASATRYAAILMDCQMPELDGYQATREIRGNDAIQQTPIIAMTAHSMPGDRERCLAAGMDDYLSKPVQPDQLSTTLQRWTTETASRQAPEEIVVREDALERAQTLDESVVDGLRESLAEEMIDQLLETFALSLPSCFDELEEAVDREDQETIRRVAHLLKGSSATLGASELHEACRRLERTGREGDPSARERLEELKDAAARAQAALRAALVANG